MSKLMRSFAALVFAVLASSAFAAVPVAKITQIEDGVEFSRDGET